MPFDLDEIRDEMGPLPVVSGVFRGALFGLITGTLVVLVLFVDALLVGETELLQSGGETGDLQTYGVVWTVLSAHLVPIEGGLGAANLIAELDGALPSVVYYLVPALSAFLAGRYVARANGHADMSSETLGAMGAFVVLGYAPVMIGAAVYSQYGGVGPAMLEAVLFAGLAYPLVFGFLGGYLAKH